MKLKNSGSISDSEHLNFSEAEDETEQLQSHLPYLAAVKNLNLKELDDVTKVTIFSTSPPTTPNHRPDPANHDKIYYDDRYNESIFDPLLARSSLPKIIISIGGMLLTGFFLNTILTWNVFTNIPELFVLIPVIFNLRVILEQGLTSRLAKASRIGVMESISGRKKIWLGNLNLVMFQSITAGMFAGLFSCFLLWISDSKLTVLRSILMVVVAAATTATTSVISGFFLFLILQVFKKFKASPDDYIGPLTTSFGGFMSLFILALYAGFFYLWLGSWFGVLAMVCLLIIGSCFFYSKAQRSEAVGTLTTEGWPSMLFSLLATGLSGLLLQRFISEYQSVFALFLPVFTGITGNFAGIYSSEAMTHLHLFQLNPLLPRKTALTLLILSGPVQLGIVILIGYLNSDQVSVSFLFLISYLITESVQVLLLIALADLLIKISWKLRMKPETNVPALMSTLSDLSGTLMLVALFYFLKSTGNLGSIKESIIEKAIETLTELGKGAVNDIVNDTLTGSVKDALTSSVKDTLADSVKDLLTYSANEMLNSIVKDTLPGTITTTMSDTIAATLTDKITTTLADTITTTVTDNTITTELPQAL